jgi:pimeloyl-ACP methyl ester carboxylesterase
MLTPNQDETKELNDETRKDAGGSFVQLSNGVTHYELANTDEQETIVLVHGFSVPYFIFDPLFQFLSDSGFRVLRYDLYGRGFSDRPDTRYNIDLFVEQLFDLLEALRFSLNVNLIGLSMGGPITATFTTRHPERVRSLTLIDPAGVRAVSLSPVLRMVKLPLVAEAALSVVGSGVFVRSAAKDFFDPNLVEQFTAQYRSQMQFKGFQRAILSTVRNNMLDSFIETYKLIGTMDKPVALFWGCNDMTVPFEYSDDLRAAIPNAEFHAIEGAGHIPHYEKPEVFNPILLSFLRNNVSKTA